MLKPAAIIALSPALSCPGIEWGYIQMAPPEPQKKRPIGFISGDEKPKEN